MRFSLIADMADPTHIRLRTSLRLGGFLGFVGGFLMAYQRSSCACCGSLYLTSINMFFSRQSVFGAGQRTSGKKKGIWQNFRYVHGKASLCMVNLINRCGYKVQRTTILLSLNLNFVSTLVSVLVPILTNIFLSDAFPWYLTLLLGIDYDQLIFAFPGSILSTIHGTVQILRNTA